MWPKIIKKQLQKAGGFIIRDKVVLLKVEFSNLLISFICFLKIYPPLVSLITSFAYIPFWQPLNLEQYNAIRNQASDIHAYAPDARVLTTYYCGKEYPTPFSRINEDQCSHLWFLYAFVWITTENKFIRGFQCLKFGSDTFFITES